jgi:hypothetical protein
VGPLKLIREFRDVSGASQPLPGQLNHERRR